MKYTVKRQHYGDRDYTPGDEREANEGEVAHLVASGVLVKAAPPLDNKAQPKPKNKST